MTNYRLFDVVLCGAMLGMSACAGQPFLRIQVNPQPILGFLGLGGTVKVPLYAWNTLSKEAVICIGEACLFVPPGDRDPNGGRETFVAKLDSGMTNYTYGSGTYSGYPRAITVTATARICDEVRFKENGMPYACIGNTVVHAIQVTLAADPYHQTLPTVFLRWDEQRGYYFSSD